MNYNINYIIIQQLNKNKIYIKIYIININNNF